MSDFGPFGLVLACFFRSSATCGTTKLHVASRDEHDYSKASQGWQHGLYGPDQDQAVGLVVYQESQTFDRKQAARQDEAGDAESNQ